MSKIQVILDGHNKIAALAVGLGNGEVDSILVQQPPFVE